MCGAPPPPMITMKFLMSTCLCSLSQPEGEGLLAVHPRPPPKESFRVQPGVSPLTPDLPKYWSNLQSNKRFPRRQRSMGSQCDPWTHAFKLLVPPPLTSCPTYFRSVLLPVCPLTSLCCSLKKDLRLSQDPYNNKSSRIHREGKYKSQIQVVRP